MDTKKNWIEKAKDNFWGEKRLWIWQSRYEKLSLIMGGMAIINAIGYLLHKSYTLSVLNLLIIILAVAVAISYKRRKGNFAGGTDGSKGTI